MQVVPGEPAARGGVMPYDIVRQVSGKKVETVEELLHEVTAVPVGTQLTLEVDRGGTIKKLEVTAAKRPRR